MTVYTVQIVSLQVKMRFRMRGYAATLTLHPTGQQSTENMSVCVKVEQSQLPLCILKSCCPGFWGTQQPLINQPVVLLLGCSQGIWYTCPVDKI